MTNLEWIQSLDAKKLAKLWCSNMDCGKCFAVEYCYHGCNGMVAWLNAGNENAGKEKEWKK